MADLWETHKETIRRLLIEQGNRSKMLELKCKNKASTQGMRHFKSYLRVTKFQRQISI
jgi:hypothetical protein